MAATRVRLVPEWRNGDDNYMKGFAHPPKFVPSIGTDDAGAFAAAMLVAIDHYGFNGKIKVTVEGHEGAHHD